MKVPIFPLAAMFALLPGLAGGATTVAADAINGLGIDLLRQTAGPGANALLSPYSIQTAMAMVCAGAEGQTREEMFRVLHYPKDEDQMDQSLADLQTELDSIMQRQAAETGRWEQYGITNDPLTLAVANHVFVQKDYNYRPAYLDLLQHTWRASLEQMDFVQDAPGATSYINDWVAAHTHERIRDLIPAGALNEDTRLVLVNAIYFKAPWATAFSPQETQPHPFNTADGTAPLVPTMFLHHELGYAHRDGCQMVVLPYGGGEVQFVIVLPDDTNGLTALETGLKPETLAGCADLPTRDLDLFLPKFKLTPPAISLSGALQSLGMKTAFDVPKGSANFDRMAPRGPDRYLFISDVFHKTFMNLDESGTEAAAATAVVFAENAVAFAPPKPVEVHVDHPFLFAIQDRASGACLFLGQMTDPR